MSRKQDLQQQHPVLYLLDAEDKEGMQRFLRQQGWLQQGEEISRIAKAGEGNMNCTLRVVTKERSFIVKQSRPWVEKYEAIDAPWDRAIIEGQFYQLVKDTPAVYHKMPSLLACDPNNRLLMFEDLGDSEDFTFLYQAQEELSNNQLQQLVEYLVHLHRIEAASSEMELTNLEMRKLNHEHIFALPLRVDNGLNLDEFTPGLQKVADTLKQDQEYVNKVKELGELYLKKHGQKLLHGDFYPGSWLKSDAQIFVIDPEFAFFGDAEFDVGVSVAHFILARCETEQITYFLNQYEQKAPVNRELLFQFAGVEIMRRLLGVAQLPLVSDLKEKTRWLEMSHHFVLKGEIS